MGEDKREAREEGLYSQEGLAQRDWAHDDEGEPAQRGPRPSPESEEDAETESSGPGSDDGTTKRPETPGRTD